MSKRNEANSNTGGSPSKARKYQEDGSPAAAAAAAGEEANAPFVLEDHFPQECWEPIAAFASANSLCALDATAKMFNSGITESAWASRAMESFGLSCDNNEEGARSKLAWRLGASLIRGQDNRRFFQLNRHPTVSFEGSPCMCACSTFVVVTSDECFDDDPGGGLYSRCISIRDSKTLEIIRTLPVPNPVFNIAICGPENGETIVVSNGRQVAAIYPSFTNSVRTADLDFRSKDDGDEGTSPRLSMFHGSGIPMIGSEKHLLVYGDGKLFIFQVNSNGISLHSKRDFLSAEQSDADISRDALAWGTKSGEFALLPGDGRICVCKLDQNTSEIEEIQSVTGSFYEKENKPLEEPLDYDYVALGENFIAACPEESKRIHIFDRASGKQIHSLFDGTGDEPEDIVIWTARLHVLGDLLFSTSSSGNALVVWNMKNGRLLQRCEEAFERGVLDRSLTSMVCIHGDGYLAFSACTDTGSEMAWVFCESRDGQCEANRLCMRHCQREDSNDDGDY